MKVNDGIMQSLGFKKVKYSCGEIKYCCCDNNNLNFNTQKDRIPTLEEVINSLKDM